MNNILHNREDCIGCGACVSIDPICWKMNDDGKADLLTKKENDFEIEHHIKTAECCPVNIIHIFKNKRKII